MTETRVPVQIGEAKVAGPGCLLFTVGLGSCVAIVLWDPEARVGGLAHAMLPDPSNGRRMTPLGRFATTAVPALVERMCAEGAVTARMRARHVSGSQPASPAIPSAAASPSSIPSGSSCSASSATSARGAIDPNGSTAISKYTRRPSPATRPTPSCPATDGSGGGPAKYCPDALRRSTGFNPATATSTTTCPSPATGSSKSPKTGVPYSCRTAACMQQTLTDATAS